MTTDSSHTQDQSQVLYRHRTRPNWGLAVMAWDHGEKRGYQFEDGKLRVFKRDFYEMLEEVDPPADRTRQVLAHLNRALGRNEAVRRAASKDEVLIPFAEQLKYFNELYPDGFGGAAWIEKIRGRGAKKQLKRHREPAVERARKKLADDVLDRLIAAQQHDEVVDTLADVLEQTGLVTAAKLKPLRLAPYHRRRTIAVALRDLLHGEGPAAPRIESYLSSIGEPSWELATAPLALVDPEHYVCVIPSVFKQQAIWIAPRLQPSRLPDAQTYLRYLKMAQGVQAQLEGAGLNPGDMMDVLDFIYMTLRPAARKILMARSAASTAGSTPEQEAA